MDIWISEEEYYKMKKIAEADEKGNPSDTSSPFARQYVRAIAKALNLKLERKLSKWSYCNEIIKKHKLEYIQYMKENGIIPPPSSKQTKYIKKMQRVLSHYYDNEDIYTTISNCKEAHNYIQKWRGRYYKIISDYYGRKLRE